MAEKRTGEKGAEAHQCDESTRAYPVEEKLSSTLANEQERVQAVAYNALDMARAHLVLKEYAQAHALIIQGLDLFRALNLETGIAESLLCLARLYACQKEFQLARRWAEEATYMYRQAGLLTELAQGLQWLGRIDYDLGQYAMAWRTFFEGVEITWRAGQCALCAFYLDWLGILLVAQFCTLACSAVAPPAPHLRTDLPAYDKPPGKALLLWAVRLWGTAEALREAERVLPIAEERFIYTPVVRLVRKHLHAGDFASAWASGRNLSPEQVLLVQTEIVPMGTSLLKTPLLFTQSLPSARRLTQREIEVLRQITLGLTDAQIAEELGISIHIFQGAGKATEIGMTTMTRSAIVSSTVDSNNCHAIMSDGYLATTKQDHITFTATGTYCGATDTATYSYTITGGTGKYKGASGNGRITVGPTTSTSGNTEKRVETWSGTLIYT